MASALQLDLALDAALQAVGRSEDLGRLHWETGDLPRTLGGTQFLVLADSTTDQALGLMGATTVTELVVLSSQVIGLRLNGGSPVVGQRFVLTGASLTSVGLDNSSGVAAQVQVLLAGS
jgi:hypothetical protein